MDPPTCPPTPLRAKTPLRKQQHYSTSTNGGSMAMIDETTMTYNSTPHQSMTAKKKTSFAGETSIHVTPAPPATPSSVTRPTPEQFVFDVQLFSEKKKGVSHTPRCPSPPLKSTPASRVISLTSNVPFVHHMSLAAPLLVDTATDTTASLFDRNFEQVARLGSGSFSDVFKTRARANHHLYAVKQARHVFRGFQERDRAVQEIKNATMMPSHENIVQYLNSWEQAGILYIQTELCERGTLKDVLEALHPISEDIIWSFLVDVCLGVAHIHAHHMLHLDIKPENLFIAHNGRLKIGDFGMAVRLEANTHNNNGSSNGNEENSEGGESHNNLSIDEDDVYFDFIEGDSRYLAPEFLTDKKMIGTASDIFSVGVTFFEMVTGKEMPLNGPLWEQLRNDHADEFLEHGIYSDQLYSCILEMMKSSISERLTLEEFFKISPVINILEQRSQNETSLKKLKRELPAKEGSAQNLLSIRRSYDTLQDDIAISPRNLLSSTTTTTTMGPQEGYRSLSLKRTKSAPPEPPKAKAKAKPAPYVQPQYTLDGILADKKAKELKPKLNLKLKK
eukprot:gene20000-23963_t